MNRVKILKRITGVSLIVSLVLILTAGCLGATWDEFNRAWKGVGATAMTFDENGQLIDKVRGSGVQFEQDDRYSSTDAEGNSNGDSGVFLLTVNGHTMTHVGSTMIVAEDGLVPTAGADTKLQYDSTTANPGVPWVNLMKDQFSTTFAPKSKIVMIRSQNGTPIAVYSGDEVQPLPTEVPKSTWFRIDGKMLWVYRADYTTYDTALIGS